MVYDNVIQAVREGVMTRNEARERLDMEPIDGGDDIYINASLFPLGMDVPDEDKTATAEDDVQFEDVYGDEEKLNERAVSLLKDGSTKKKSSGTEA